MVERSIYILLHTEQLNVSALDNGHLQVVHESLNKLFYKHIYIYIYIWATDMGKWEGKVGTRSRICQKGLDVWDAWRIHAVIKQCLSLITGKSMVVLYTAVYRPRFLPEAYRGCYFR